MRTDFKFVEHHRYAPAMNGNVSRATVSRWPLYLRSLSELPIGRVHISSSELGQRCGVGASQVRRDILDLGSTGVRGVGYDVTELSTALRKALNADQQMSAVIVGAGNLGTALARYPGMNGAGIEVVAMFDSDPEKIGKGVGGITVEPMSALATTIERSGRTIGIVAVPASAAANVASLLVRAGAVGILNFAPTVLGVPEGVQLHRLDVSTELQVLKHFVLNDRS